MKPVAAAAALAAALVCYAAVTTADSDNQAVGSSWWRRVSALADDAMEGRQTGTPGHTRAADYVTRSFQAVGLEPAGTDGFIQRVGFRTRTIDEPRSSVSFVRDGRTRSITLGVEATISMRADPAPRVAAPLVFVGRALRVPDRRVDDLGALDLRGAIAVYFTTTPDSLDAAARAQSASTAERWRTLREAGAIGTITIANPHAAETPWARSSAQRLQPYISLADAALDEFREQQIAITMNPAHAELLFEGSGRTFAELVALDEAGKPLGSFPLPTRVEATVAAARSEVESENVAGVLRGREPSLRDEFVVVSAHLDHLGVSPIGSGDRIYNGAMDNASGVAAILEAASLIHQSSERPARSILFLAVTGEEHGELGSRYFVVHPTVPRSSIVANLNTDMFLPLFPLRQLMALGLEESDLALDVRAVGRRFGVGVQADPEPGRNRFARSDQYSFVRAGIPALGLKVGYDPDSAEAETVRVWMADRYHGVSDDLSQPVNIEAAGLFVRALEALTLHVANRPDRPAWNERSRFKRLAARP